MLYSYSKDILANGLRVVTVEVPYLHSTDLALYVKVGSRYEDIEYNGISHFLEHMFFRGTEKYPSSLMLNSALEQIGDGLSANTYRELTTYWTKIDSALLEQSLVLFADIFRRPKLDNVELEREIILEELLLEEDEDGENIDIDNLSRQLLWPHNPLGFSVIGSRESIGHIKREHLLEHFHSFYVPSHMILCATGQIQRAHVLDLAQKYFGDSEGLPPRPFPAVTENQTTPQVLFKKIDAAQRQVQFVWRAYHENHPSIRILVLIQRIFDDGLSSRLQSTICEKQALAYDIEASIDGYSDVGLFDIEVSVGPGKLTRVVSAVMDEIQRLVQEPVGDQELQKVKDRFARDCQFLLDSPRQLSILFGEAELTHVPRTPEEMVAEVTQITSVDIMRVAQEIFQPKNFNLVVLGPYTGKEKETIQKKWG